MISEALYALLTSLVSLTDIVGDRISPAAFREEEAVLGITFNTSDVRPIACRDADGSKTGLLEIGIMAPSIRQLQILTETLTDKLDNYEGVYGGYALYLSLSTADFDERVENLRANYKAIQFDFTATKLQ